jgi:hypothetical protein
MRIVSSPAASFEACSQFQRFLPIHKYRKIGQANESRQRTISKSVQKTLSQISSGVFANTDVFELRRNPLLANISLLAASS